MTKWRSGLLRQSLILGRKLYLLARNAFYAYGMLSRKVEPFYEINIVASRQLCVFFKRRT